MEDGIDDAAILCRLQLEEDGEREATDKRPAVGLMNYWMAEGRALYRKKGGFDAPQEFHAEPH